MIAFSCKMESVNYYAGARTAQLHNKVAVYGCHNSWPQFKVEFHKTFNTFVISECKKQRCIDPSIRFPFQKNARERKRGKKYENWLLAADADSLIFASKFHTFVRIFDVNLITVMKMVFFENATIHFNAPAHSELCNFSICLRAIGEMCHPFKIIAQFYNELASERVCCGSEQTRSDAIMCDCLFKSSSVIDGKRVRRRFRIDVDMNLILLPLCCCH